MATIIERKNSRGELTYQVKVRIKGYPAETATFERKTDAKKWAQATEASMRERRYFKNTEAKKKTVADMIDRYISEILPTKKKSTANQRGYLNWWKNQIGEYSLSNITSSLIAEHRSKLFDSTSDTKRTRGATTANRYMTALGAVYTIAINDWEWVQENPVRKVSKFPENRGRVRFLDDDERERLLVACHQSDNPHLYVIVVLALSTGARKSEILHIKWKDVDLVRGRVTLNETKNDERRSLPLKGYAYDLMKAHFEQRNSNCDFVFPSEKICQPIEIKRAWETALKRAKIEDFRFHDLRHCAASYLAMNGASTSEIAEVLGHKTLQMVKRYAHLAESHTSKVVESMNDKIFKDKKHEV